MARYWSWTGTVLGLLMVMQSGAASNVLKVGGKGAWVPPPESDKGMYNQWAGRNRFLINDTIVFTYNPSVDSVLNVNKEDYDSCNTSNPKTKYQDGNTSFTFPRHSFFYFISGNATNCQKGEKVVIVVLAPRIKTGAPAPTVASPPPSSVAPSPAPSTAASPPPSSVAPSPAPSTAASPPPVAPSPGASVVPVVAPSLASPTAASVPSPALAPGNSAPFLSSPAPTPSEGGVVPAPSAGNGVRPRLASAAVAVVVLALWGAF